MSKLKTIIATAALVLSFQISANAADISDWALNDYIESNSAGLLSYGMVSGDLRSNITREEFCELAVNLYNKLSDTPLSIPNEPYFTDCDNVAVNQMYYNGMVTGVEKKKFEPNRAVTRQEMAVILVNVLNASEVDNVIYNISDGVSALRNFIDYNKIHDWAESAFATVVGHALLSGNDDNEIMPLENTTREQAMICINRAYKMFAQNKAAGYALPVVTAPVSGSTTKGDWVITWEAVPEATEYYVLVKDVAGNVIYSSTLGASSCVEIIGESEIAPGAYSVAVGVKLPTSESIFSVPSDFTVEATFVAPEVVPAIKTELTGPITNYDHEVLSPQAKAILLEAEKYLGIKYVYGGTTPAGFDCSGFVQYVFRNCGITLKRVSRDQYAYNGVSVPKSELQPGDLVFFGTGGVVSHVGIYAGGGQMIHSPSTGKSICYTTINSNYYVSRYIGAKRVLK